MMLLMMGLAVSGCQTVPSDQAATSGPGAAMSRIAVDPRPKECPAAAAPACPKPKPVVVEKVIVRTLEVPVEIEPQTAGELGLPIVGAVEWVTVQPPGLRLEARIDTGAETSSIHAEDVELVEKDGKRYVRYTLRDPETGEAYPLESRVRRRVLIKQEEDQHDRRYVVRMWVALGEARLHIDVTLANRAGMDYPLLIGRNMLTDVAIVDVARHHTLVN